MSRLHTILLTDDEPDLREVVAETLAEAGYAVLTATDGHDAVRVLADNWVNLLITDVKMPGIDGFELARQAKVMRPQIQVIYVSGYDENGTKNDGPVYGPVLVKPFRLAELVAAVDQLLE